ncbi:hypothetical protein [Alloactinosynnema sp. L-07]|uniref:hypothetical protein n=1 Tax=Alloactinosynnema sp. L-07 TaxID=1653480 RepID=UPI00065EF14B|nr:hypothetical protein [Alloactinosynnema sp. L-07]CRK56911.1 hypothetical protein [Alloactinosynnema sp. L-07]
MEMLFGDRAGDTTVTTWTAAHGTYTGSCGGVDGRSQTILACETQPESGNAADLADAGEAVTFLDAAAANPWLQHQRF